MGQQYLDVLIITPTAARVGCIARRCWSLCTRIQLFWLGWCSTTIILVFSPGSVNDPCQNWDLNVNFYQIDLYVAIIIKIFHSLYKYVNVRLQNGYKMSTFTWFSYILRLYVVCYWGRVSSMLIIFVRTLICTHTDWDLDPTLDIDRNTWYHSRQGFNSFW